MAAFAKSEEGSGKTVSQYVASLVAARRKEFTELRELVSKALPETKLTMSYGMPTWEIGGPVCAAASQKRYLALYVCELESLDRHRGAFAHLDVGKSCIRFKTIEAM